MKKSLYYVEGVPAWTPEDARQGRIGMRSNVGLVYVCAEPDQIEALRYERERVRLHVRISAGGGRFVMIGTVWHIGRPR